MKSGVTLLATALSLAVITAPARAQHAGHPVSAVGTYDLQIELGGMAQSSVLTLSEKDGKLGGTLTLHGQPAKVDSVELKGHEMTMQVAMPHGSLKLSLTFKSSDELSGTFAMEGMGNGTISGTRRKS